MKKLIALLLALVMVMSLAACTAPAPAADADQPGQETTKAPENNNDQQDPPTGGDKENVKIEVYIAQVDWADAWDVMEAKFEEEHPWIDVEHVGLGEDTTFLQTRLSTNDLPDVIQINKNPTWEAMVQQGLLTDLTNYECAAVMPDAYKAAYSVDGKLLGMCQGAAFSCMFYNMAILEEAGWTAPPANWDELLKCCADVAALGYAPLVTAAGKTTTSWMLFECILANVNNGSVEYEEAFKAGTFDFGQFPEVAARLDAIAPYFLEGTAAAMEEDAIAYMTDGLAAMCLAGNWNGAQIADAIATATGDPSKAAASLPPFGANGVNWISTSPEDAFAVTVNPNRTAAEQEAVDTFFNWVFEAENFALIQNARGTVPVITNMTSEYIKLPECVVPVVADMGSAPFVLMGFNLWAAEFSDAANGKIRDLLSGGATGQDVLDIMVATLPNSYRNAG